MSPYAKFGLDRPSRSAGYRQHTDKQTDITRFIIWMKQFRLVCGSIISTKLRLRIRIIKTSMYSVSQKKIPPEDLWQYFQNGWEFFNQILHAYYAFLSTLDYEFLFKYLQV